MFLFTLLELLCRLNDKIKQQFSWLKRLFFVLEKWILNRTVRTLLEKRTYIKTVSFLWLNNNVCNIINLYYFGISNKESRIKIYVTMWSTRRWNTRKRGSATHRNVNECWCNYSRMKRHVQLQYTFWSSRFSAENVYGGKKYDYNWDFI